MVKQMGNIENNAQFLTGTEASISGYYEFVKYTDGSVYPSPKDEEKKIYVARGGKFPRVESRDKNAWYRIARST